MTYSNSSPNDTPYSLTPFQITSFHTNGYLLIPDVLSSSEVRNLQKWTAEVKSWGDKPGEHMAYLETRSDGSMGLCRTENYANYHEGFGALFRGKRMVGVLGELMGEEAVLFKEKINYKEAGGSGGFDAHIDASAYTHAGANKHQTFLMAVNDMDMANGCLEVVPGSHKVQIPLAPNRCIDPTWESSQTWLPVPMPAGSVLVFGSYLAHRSGANSSPKPRAAIYATYNAVSEGDNHDSYYEHRRKIWPPDSERVKGEKYHEGAMIYAFGSPMAGGKEAIAEVLGRDTKKNEDVKEKVQKLFEILEAQGDADYIGEPISQLEHSLQAALLAKQSNASPKTIAAALLHDIGQFLPSTTAQSMAENVGRMGHEKLGEVYLRELGMNSEVAELVGAHVIAKKYLTAVREGYYEALSDASKASLKYQGGPFTPTQVEEFLKDPLWEQKVQLREWDDQAKRTDLDLAKNGALEGFRGIVEQAWVAV